MLELARADALELSNQTSSLPDIIKAVQNRYQERGLELVYPTPLLENRLAIAPEPLDVVITNLLDNSLQHGATQVSVQTRVVENGLQLVLQDNGAGISPANRDKIFTPFFTTRRSKGGTGLGLEIIASVLKTYGGSVRLLDITPGAAFCVELPLDKG